MQFRGAQGRLALSRYDNTKEPDTPGGTNKGARVDRTRGSKGAERAYGSTVCEAILRFERSQRFVVTEGRGRNKGEARS